MPLLSKSLKTDNLYLFLNTSSPAATEFIITDRISLLARKKGICKSGRFDLLYSLMNVLKRLKRSPRDISCMYIVEGPGMFSHLRTGISIAQSWQYVFSTPIRTLRADEFPLNNNDIMRLIGRLSGKMKKGLLLPIYGAQPSITMKK